MVGAFVGALVGDDVAFSALVGTFVRAFVGVVVVFGALVGALVDDLSVMM